MTEHKAKDATCTVAGNSAYWGCDQCNKFFSDAEGKTEINKNSWAINAKGHKWDNGKVTKNATTTAEGIKTITCTVCGEKKTESIPKLAKRANPLKIKARTAKVKYKKFKKKAQKLAVTKVI